MAYHSLKDEIGEKYFSEETIVKYIKAKVKNNPDHKLQTFDYNLFDESGVSLFCYAISSNTNWLFEKMVKASEQTDGSLLYFIKYTSPEYPIHTICRLGDYDKFLALCKTPGAQIVTQFQNLKDQNGDSPFEVLSNLPEVDSPNREEVKAGKIKIASYLASHYPKCIKTTHENEYEETKPYTQHVRDKGFPEFAAILEAHSITMSK